MSIFQRISKMVRCGVRQVRAALETDFFASSLKNDEAVLAALEALVRAREKDQKRIELLAAEVRQLREELGRISGGGAK